METKETKSESAKESKKSGGFKIRPLYIFAAIAFIAILGIIYIASAPASPSVVAVGDTINVSYTGTFINGTVFDSNVGKTPLQFTVGSGLMISGFDHAVVGMHVNEEKTVTLTANEAYGEIDPTLFVQVPANTFKNQTVQTGMVIERTANEQQQRGTVTAVNATTITIDFNPPLAGHTLVFAIKVLTIQKG
jgi:peptidylprolyl isomerase